MSKLQTSIRHDRIWLIRDRVRIDPYLTTDPYHHRGSDGTIIAKTTDGDYVIKFDDKTIGIYEDDTFKYIRRKKVG